MTEVRLSISPIEGFPGNYKVIVSGFGFEQFANRQVNWKLRGDDTVFDDNIIHPRGGGIVPRDGIFGFESNAISGNLNEDWGEDEIYAIVSIGSLEFTSNTVKGHF